MVYEFEDDLTPIRHTYPGDQKAIEKATQAVADQQQQKPYPRNSGLN